MRSTKRNERGKTVVGLLLRGDACKPAVLEKILRRWGPRKMAEAYATETVRSYGRYGDHYWVVSREVPIAWVALRRCATTAAAKLLLSHRPSLADGWSPTFVAKWPETYRQAQTVALRNQTSMLADQMYRVVTASLATRKREWRALTFAVRYLREGMVRGSWRNRRRHYAKPLLDTLLNYNALPALLDFCRTTPRLHAACFGPRGVRLVRYLLPQAIVAATAAKAVGFGSYDRQLSEFLSRVLAVAIRSAQPALVDAAIAGGADPAALVVATYPDFNSGAKPATVPRYANGMSFAELANYEAAHASAAARARLRSIAAKLIGLGSRVRPQEQVDALVAANRQANERSRQRFAKLRQRQHDEAMRRLEAARARGRQVKKCRAYGWDALTCSNHPYYEEDLRRRQAARLQRYLRNRRRHPKRPIATNRHGNNQQNQSRQQRDNRDKQKAQQKAQQEAKQRAQQKVQQQAKQQTKQETKQKAQQTAQQKAQEKAKQEAQLKAQQKKLARQRCLSNCKASVQDCPPKLAKDIQTIPPEPSKKKVKKSYNPGSSVTGRTGGWFGIATAKNLASTDAFNHASGLCRQTGGSFQSKKLGYWSCKSHGPKGHKEFNCTVEQVVVTCWRAVPNPAHENWKRAREAVIRHNKDVRQRLVRHAQCVSRKRSEEQNCRRKCN